MDGDRSQRISQRGKRKETSDCSLLEQAEAFAQRVNQFKRLREQRIARESKSQG